MTIYIFIVMQITITMKERLKKLIKERENLRIFFSQCPINCSLCGNRMEDLIQDPCSLFWFCKDCYDWR